MASIGCGQSGVQGDAGGPNEAPAATVQTLTTPEDTDLDVLLGGVDADGDALSFAVQDQPAHGSISGTPPNIKYAPDANFVGEDSFSFTADDGQAQSAKATVSITVTAVNDAPTADAGAHQNVFPDETVNLDGTASSDPIEGDAISSYTWQQVYGTPVTLDLSTPSAPSFKAPKHFGVLIFSLTVNDGVDNSENVAEIRVTVINPVAAESQHSLALYRDGTVVSWGDNSDGQLGNGTTTDHAVPAPVCAPGQMAPCSTFLTGISAVTAGKDQSFALTPEGHLYGFGDGLLGVGDATPTDVPTRVCAVGEPDACTVHLTNVIEVASSPSFSDGHTLVLLRDGQVAAFGLNGSGQLGQGGTSSATTPLLVCNVGQTTPCVNFLDDIVAVSAGDEFSLALKSDGTVYSWGKGEDGRLGIGNEDEQLVPVQVCAEGEVSPCSAFLTDIIAISAGFGQALALADDGTVWAWGSNLSSELGNGAAVDVWTPTKVCDNGETSGCSNYLSNVRHIAAVQVRGFAVKDNGSLWSWGGNSKGGLGIGTIDVADVPQQVCAPGETAPCSSFLNNIVSVEGSSTHTIAMDQNEELYAWGNNFWGALGFDPARNTFEKVGSDTWLKVGTGRQSAMAINDSGELYGWGANGFGQLGIGDKAGRHVPTRVGLQTDWTDVSSGFVSGAGIRDDSGNNTAWSWGANSGGALGTGDFVESTSPKAIWGVGQTDLSGPFLQNVVALEVGNGFAMALQDQGGSNRLLTWGSGYSGATGQGDTTNRPVPEEITLAGCTDVIGIAAGNLHGMALCANGEVWAWGDNFNGQVGNGDSGIAADVFSPVKVCHPTLDCASNFLTNIDKIAAINGTSYAISNSGQLYAWGRNLEGQLGTGDEIDVVKPTLIAKSGVDDIADGAYAFHALIRSSTQIRAVGKGSDGQLGSGTNDNISTPTPITIPDCTTPAAENHMMSVGDDFSLLICDGDLYSTGDNLDGQLGDGNAWSLVPILLP